LARERGFKSHSVRLPNPAASTANASAFLQTTLSEAIRSEHVLPSIPAPRNTPDRGLMLLAILSAIVFDRRYSSRTAKWGLGTKCESKMFRCSQLCLRSRGMHLALRQACHSVRSACIVSTLAARAAGTNDARTADVTTTAADPSNGIKPGS